MLVGFAFINMQTHSVLKVFYASVIVYNENCFQQIAVENVQFSFGFRDFCLIKK